MGKSLAVLASAGLVACGLTVVGSADRPPGARPTGSFDASPANGDGSPVDGAPSTGADAGLGGGDAGCSIVFDDDLTASVVAWDLLGEASPGTNGVALTPQTSSAVAGAMWRKTPLSFAGRLDVVVDVSFETAPGDPAGDGMTVAWLQTPPSYVLGSAGLSMGLCAAGMIGTAVELDEAQGHLTVLNGFSGNCDTAGAIASGVAVATARQVTVEIRPDGMTATLDVGDTESRQKTIPTSGYLGITAATGSGNTRHVVGHVRATSCP